VKIDGSTILITGANRGLGAHLASRVLEAGAAKVYAAARNTAMLPPEFVSDQRVVPLALDIDDEASIAAAARAAADVRILINNAGVLGFGDVLEGDLALFERDMATNYFGTLRMSRAFAPVLAANAPAAIVNVLTLIALAPMGPMAGYCASKAAAHSMTQALRASVRSMGIEVIGAYPGGIDTDMLASVDGDKAEPGVVAARIVTGIEAGEQLIWPDDASFGAGSVYLDSPLRLEVLLAG
jgi:NAD(P)-dependent dehydrogenase (short-subunit alcohol dehydrogenase family)